VIALGETTESSRVSELEALLTAQRTEIENLIRERDHLRASHERLRLELELLKRRLFIAKAERIDTAQLELEFADKLRQLDALSGLWDSDEEFSAPEPRPRKKPTGRRDLRKLALEEERIEIADPLYEELVEANKAKRIGFEESCRLGYKRGGMRRLVLSRVKYQVTTLDGEATVATAQMPPHLFARSIVTPSLLAHILMEKYGKGLPLFRIEEAFARDGVPLDRGTMCRWVEDAGATCGATVIHAARKDALNAFCIATDATGVSVQPIRGHEKVRKPCKRGHYFVHIADRDHVFFEYTARETSDAVANMFKGYSGYIQADAKSVYDILFRKPPDEDDETVRHEVGCFAHCRRKFWEAAMAKSDVAREGLARIRRIFELDAEWRKKPPSEIKRLRDHYLRPHMEAFFRWAAHEYDIVQNERGLLRSALGYAVRQKEPLMRVLDDGRLALDNNRSERALRSIAVGRKAWLFVGSDDHAESAGHILSLIASCKLHNLDPETYLRDLFRVLAHWPNDRYLELAPKYWATTRAQLDPVELEQEIGWLKVPEKLPPPAEQQTTANLG
jgi:transposase